MSETALGRLAALAGLESVWRDGEGVTRRVEPAVLRSVLVALGFPAATDAQCRESEAALLDEQARAWPLWVVPQGTDLRLPGGAGRWRIRREDGEAIEGCARDDGICAGSAALPPGYHQVEKAGDLQRIAVVPDRAFTLAEVVGERRLAGLAAQVYALRGVADEGIGDFFALEQLALRAPAHGIEALAISPVHALSTATGAHASPYSPSSRIALDPAYATFDAGAGSTRRDEPDALIDWRATLARKLAAARRAFAIEETRPRFTSFCAQASPDLLPYALFEAIAADQVAKRASADWRRWPKALRDRNGEEVAAFAEREARRVRFQLFLQYRASLGLEAAAKAAKRAGMAVGLMTDLAVGVDPGGADAWARRDEMLEGVSIGAPPDFFNRDGQRWGLTSFSPIGLRRSGFAGVLAVLRAAFRYSGGVRIDHALGLGRLWLIPDGAPATAGVYVHYPFADLVGLIALESRRHRSIVLAEDLGTVPPGFADQLTTRGLAGLNVLWLERTAARFQPPEAWRANAAAMTSTHDMPTVAGWWAGRDIAWRRALGLASQSESDRERDRALLWSAFVAAGTARGPEPPPTRYEDIVDAAAAYLGRTASRLALLPLEDALGLLEQPNIPGTIDQHPNWRRRMPEAVETMLDRPAVATRLAAFVAGRTRT